MSSTTDCGFVAKGVLKSSVPRACTILFLFILFDILSLDAAMDSAGERFDLPAEKYLGAYIKLYYRSLFTLE